MIERVNERLLGWVKECRKTMDGGGGSCILGVLIDSPAAETRYHRRKQRQVKRDKQGNIIQLVTGEPTAAGVQTRVPPQKQAPVDDVHTETSKAVARLPDHLRSVLHVYYFQGELALEVRARRLGISVRTMYRRLDGAHVILDHLMFGAVLPGVAAGYPQAVHKSR